MSVFESINQASSQAIDNSELFLKKSHDYYKLKIFEQLTKSVSMMFKAFALGGLFLISLFFLAIALGLYIGEALENYTTGFLIVGLIFIIICVILFFKRKFIDKLVIQNISKSFFTNE